MVNAPSHIFEKNIENLKSEKAEGFIMNKLIYD